jgi:deoxyuridine 5'-triphosphate nucleotidohydrolase
MENDISLGKKLGFFKMDHRVIDPYFATEGSACFDVHAFLPDERKLIEGYNYINKKIFFTTATNHEGRGFFVLNAGSRVLVPTGIILDIPKGYSVRGHVRSSISIKQGLFLSNGEGIIDSDYHHELWIPLSNNTDTGVVIEHGTRLLQAELVETLDYRLIETRQKPTQTTDRVGGVGSTGV